MVLRNVLIIHGKGRDDKSHANIVRSYVARWLTEFDDVQAYCNRATASWRQRGVLRRTT